MFCTWGLPAGGASLAGRTGSSTVPEPRPDSADHMQLKHMSMLVQLLPILSDTVTWQLAIAGDIMKSHGGSQWQD